MRNGSDRLTLLGRVGCSASQHSQPGSPYADVVPRPRRALPADLANDWPTRPSTDPTVETARQFALNLADAMQGMSLRAAKTATGVDHTTIAAILHGTVWPDLHTIARLEHGLATDLWPTGAATTDTPTSGD